MEDIGIDAALTASLLAGLRASTGERFGWNNVVGPGLVYNPELLTKISPTELEVSIPMFREFAISVPELVTLTVPGSALTSNQSIVASPAMRVPAIPGAATLEGPLVNGTNEVHIRKGDGINFNLTLSNDSWVPGVGGRRDLPPRPAHPLTCPSRVPLSIRTLLGSRGSLYFERELSLALLRAIMTAGAWGLEARGWHFSEFETQPPQAGPSRPTRRSRSCFATARHRIVTPMLLEPDPAAAALGLQTQLPLYRADDRTMVFEVEAAPSYDSAPRAAAPTFGPAFTL